MKLSHLVDAEYGNQGIDFKMVPREGFGWMNGMSDSRHAPFFKTFVLMNILVRYAAAYQVGLSFLTTHMRRAVAACTSPEVFFGIGSSADVAMNQMRDNTVTDALGLAMEALTMSASSG